MSRQEELEKQMKLNALEHSMERRASVSELQEKGILKGAPGMSAALIDKAEQLEKRAPLRPRLTRCVSEPPLFRQTLRRQPHLVRVRCLLQH